MEVKDRIQKTGVNKWYEADCKGTLQYATGVGKSRCGVLASGWLVKQIEDPSILIITPTQTIRDQAWRDEFKKWGAKSIFDDCVECVCIQTAYKYVDKHYDLVICDEIHNYIPVSEEYEYFKFFDNNTYDKLLGLSASIDEELIPKLNTIAPIVDVIDTNMAVELGLVSPFVIYNIPIKMDEKARKEYARWDAEFHATFSLFDKDLGLMFKCLKDSSVLKYHLQRKFNLKPSEVAYSLSHYKTFPYRCNTAMRERKKLLYENTSKLSAIGKIVKMFKKRKGVVFNQTAAFADKVGELVGDTCIAEHSKIKKKVRLENLNKFQDGRTKIRMISAVKSLNEGANLKGVDFVVIASGTSKIKDFIQRVGRSIRWEDGKTAVVVRLYMANSQEEKWVESSQEGYDVITLRDYTELEKRVRDLSEQLEEIGE
jgi:superfamily II DNA or RNA helicase